jgi:hypothetical protein
MDHVQLVRVIEVGMDVDGDGAPDVDGSRVYFIGPSAGGRQGTIFLALEPDVRAGVLNVPGSSIQGPALFLSRGGLGLGLQSRVPSLLNAPGVSTIDGVTVTAPLFQENMPLRHGAPYGVVLQSGTARTIRSPLVNDVPGAIEIQQAMERAEWAYQQACSEFYGSRLRRQPLAGVPPKAIIVQFPFGDRVVPNPATAELLRNSDLVDRATFVRMDLAFAVNPTPFPGNLNLYPHAFLQIFANPTLTALALQAEGQIASFFALDGDAHVLNPFDASQITDPDPGGPIFEVPIVLPLPVRLNYPLSGGLAVSFPSDAAPLATEPAVTAGERDALRPRAPLAAWPVPFVHGTLHISFATDGREAVSAVDIYNLSGRHVRRIVGSGAHADRCEMTWDGRDERGTVARPSLRSAGG